MTNRQLAALFADFNAWYFGGRLPYVTVRFSTGKYLYMRGMVKGTLIGGKYGEHVPKYIIRGRGWNARIRLNHDNEVQRRIVLSHAASDKEQMPRTLLHEMIHASGIGDHGEAFAAETRRLKALGAPVNNQDLKAKPGKGKGRAKR